MATVTAMRWLAPTILAAGLGMAAFTPTPAYARDGDDLVRVLVDVADVIYHGGYPYYRYDRGYVDRLIVVRDRHGRRTYYRDVPRVVYRQGPPYGHAYGYWKHHPDTRSRMQCDHRGRCVTRYYDARYDRRHDNRYYRYDDRYGYERRHRDRDWDDDRWRRHDHD